LVVNIYTGELLEIMENILIESFKKTESLIQNFYTNTDNVKELQLIAEKMAAAFNNGKKILICGNGGSLCDAMHFAEEFTGRYQKDRRPLPVIALADPAHLTCVGNDFGFDEVFARGVEALGQPGDWFISLSTSGNSANILKAITKAKDLGLVTWSLLGKDGGPAKGMAQHEFIIPGKTSDRIQEVHMLILHVIIEGVERILFPENYRENI